jgi:hypothetical protein
MATTKTTDTIAKEYSYRLVNRLLPREVYCIGASSASHAAEEMVKAFMRQIHDRRAREIIIDELEKAIGEEFSQGLA